MRPLAVRRRVGSVIRRTSALVAAGSVSVRRRLGRRRDRRDHPTAPVSVLVLEGQAPEQVAGFGRSLFAATKARYATASDVVWLSADRVAVSYLLTSTIAVFDLDDSSGTPRLEVREQVGSCPGFAWPTAITASPDRRWLAAANSAEGSMVVLPLSGDRNPSIGTVSCSVAVSGDCNLHGIAASPDGRVIAYTSIDVPGGIRLVRVEDDDGRLGMRLVATIDNIHSPLKPKGIRFSPDGRFVFLAYGGNVTHHRSRMVPGFIEVRRYDMHAGAIGEIVCRTDDAAGFLCPEAIAVYPDGSRIVVTDQVDDSARVIEFDRETGRLGAVVLRIGWAAGGLSSPHGCAVSPDQRWIAIANYGDASVRFFTAPVPPTGQLAG